MFYLCGLMKIKLLVCSIFLLLLALVPARAQYVVTGSAPAGTRWSRLKGDHFDIIYPAEIDSLAREYLYAFEKSRNATLAGLHIETPRMQKAFSDGSMDREELIRMIKEMGIDVIDN